MKKLTFVLMVLFLAAQISAHCGGCGPKDSVSKKMSSEELTKMECSSCQSKDSAKLTLTKREAAVCDEILSDYKAELSKLKSKYRAKFDKVLSEEELATYLEQHELTQI
tara:strand:- start:2061 stop:2387 length:327 start_codon:yes stop_codon:yes gene_type:complete